MLAVTLPNIYLYCSHIGAVGHYTHSGPGCWQVRAHSVQGFVFSHAPLQGNIWRNSGLWCLCVNAKVNKAVKYMCYSKNYIISLECQVICSTLVTVPNHFHHCSCSWLSFVYIWLQKANQRVCAWLSCLCSLFTLNHMAKARRHLLKDRIL